MSGLDAFKEFPLPPNVDFWAGVIDVKSTITETVMLAASITSSTPGGSGTMITSTLAISPSGSTKSGQRDKRDMRQQPLRASATLDLPVEKPG
jgi:hypothetical protein